VTFLLDVNVLIALIDPTHVHHGLAHDWFEHEGGRAWATCPITENGVVRIVGHPRYPNAPGSPAAVCDVLRRFRERPGHVFWPDTISLMDIARLDTDRLLSHAQVTDSYLLALAMAHGGKLASLDRRLSVVGVHGGGDGLHLLQGFNHDA
jgi:toxin-antitoxin system PIN domain toxin